jgi:hypothetical protein
MMLRMSNEAMRRLANIYSIKRSEGVSSVPQAFVEKSLSCHDALRDVGCGELPRRTSQRLGSSDGTDSREPLGRMFNPSGRFCTC